MADTSVEDEVRESKASGVNEEVKVPLSSSSMDQKLMSLVKQQKLVIRKLELSLKKSESRWVFISLHPFEPAT